MRATPLLLAAVTAMASPPPSSAQPPFGLVLHGGAGVIRREAMTPELETEYRAKLAEALRAGYAILEGGGPALDAVVVAVQVLEESPLFNAGRGAVLNAEGVCELDASIMDGSNLKAGAVAGLRRVRSPIQLARDVMEKSAHVFLVGEGAERFAAAQGHGFVPNDYFQTERRREQLRRAQELESRETRGTSAVPLELSSPGVSDTDYFRREQRYGTVGCVALDRAGNLAAGTSTGGMTNKRFGRVGDVPVIGAGTYARNETCAVSATGWGEFFIRATVGHDISAQMEYLGRDLPAAASATLAKVARLGGDGGVIGIDRLGRITMDFNSEGMYRAAKVAGRAEVVAIYAEEPRQ